MAKRSILIVGGGTAGWLTAAYLARFFDLARNPRLSVTLLASDEIGSIGVGEGAFPTIRNTLQYIGIDESEFVRRASATFKQGIRFDDWVRTPREGQSSHFLHPFEAPYHGDGHSLVSYWLLQDEATRRPFAEAMTIQNRVAEAQRAPKRPGEEAFGGWFPDGGEDGFGAFFSKCRFRKFHKFVAVSVRRPSLHELYFGPYRDILAV